MGYIKRQYENDQENKILSLRYDFGYEIWELRPIAQSETEEYYIGPKNVRIV